MGGEVEFARIAVINADHLLKTSGKEALTELLNPTGPYFFHGTSVFLMSESGGSIIDPISKKRCEHDLMKFKDAAGHYPFKLLLGILKNKEEAQVVLSVHSASSMKDQNRIIYARHGKMGGIPVILGKVINVP